MREFTGLTDKNGVDIFRGDTVSTENSSPEYDIWTIEDRGYAKVEWSRSKGVSFIGTSDNGCCWDWDSNGQTWDDIKFMVVIKNDS